MVSKLALWEAYEASKHKSQKKIAKQFNISRQRVHQVIKEMKIAMAIEILLDVVLKHTEYDALLDDQLDALDLLDQYVQELRREN